MRRIPTILLMLASATVVAGCGGQGDQGRAQFAPDAGHVDVLTRASGLPEGHPPVDPHHRRWALPEGHPPVREALPGCRGLGRTPRHDPDVFQGEAPDVPELISI